MRLVLALCLFGLALPSHPLGAPGYPKAADAVPSASGAASVRVWHITSRGWDPWTERPLPEVVRVAYPLLVFDYAPRYAEGLAALTQWVREGAIRYREDILEGIEQAPDAIAGLYRGENLGKRLIRLL